MEDRKAMDGREEEEKRDRRKNLIRTEKNTQKDRTKHRRKQVKKEG